MKHERALKEYDDIELLNLTPDQMKKKDLVELVKELQERLKYADKYIEQIQNNGPSRWI